MTIKQGTVLPTTGIGTGYLLLFIYVIIGWNIGFQELLKVPHAYILILIPASMQFSYKDFIIKENDMEGYYYKYRILILFHFEKRFDFNDFTSVVIRVMNKNYNVQQGIGPGISVVEGKHKEKYLAIVGYRRNGEITEVCKGKKHNLDKVIKTSIQPLDIPVYLGAPRKGYEYDPKI